MKTYYEWVEEKIERVHGDIEPDFNDPGQLHRFCRLVGDNEDTEEYYFRLGLARNVNDPEILEKEWAYFTQADGLPEYFSDEQGRRGANVPQKLLKEFQRNADWIKEKYIVE